MREVREVREARNPDWWITQSLEAKRKKVLESGGGFEAARILCAGWLEGKENAAKARQ